MLIDNFLFIAFYDLKFYVFSMILLFEGTKGQQFKAILSFPQKENTNTATVY